MRKAAEQIDFLAPLAFVPLSPTLTVAARVSVVPPAALSS